MSKDPAVLFYTADFLTATNTWKSEHVGMYARLLFNQHIIGHMDMEDITDICKGPVPKKVLNKFTQDENGLYYNIIMKQRIEERKAFTESRRNNRLGKTKTTEKNNTSQTHDNHMSGHMEDENENLNIREDIMYNGATYDTPMSWELFSKKIYPNYNSSEDAKPLFMKYIFNQKNWDNLLLAYKNYSKTAIFKENNGEKIKNLGTFMKDWRDYLMPNNNKSAANKAQSDKNKLKYNNSPVNEPIAPEITKFCSQIDCKKEFNTRDNRINRCPECDKKHTDNWLKNFNKNNVSK